MDDLASQANMSTSTFHHHFRSLTALSPLQFQKQLRLQEARRLMLAERMDAAKLPFRSAMKVRLNLTVNTTVCSVRRRYAMFLNSVKCPLRHRELFRIEKHGITTFEQSGVSKMWANSL
jgi:AraC-like DNA-binding protein